MSNNLFIKCPVLNYFRQDFLSSILWLLSETRKLHVWEKIFFFNFLKLHNGYKAILKIGNERANLLDLYNVTIFFCHFQNPFTNDKVTMLTICGGTNYNNLKNICFIIYYAPCKASHTLWRVLTASPVMNVGFIRVDGLKMLGLWTACCIVGCIGHFCCKTWSVSDWFAGGQT